MSWAKLCDSILDHPKFADLDDAGWSLFVRGLVWACKHRTEGQLPRTVVERLGKRAVVRELLTRRIWEPTDDGYQIHGFLEYNLDRHGGKPPPSPALRAARADAGRRGALAKWQGRGKSDGKTSHPAMAKVPSEMAKLATPVIPRSRDPGQRLAAQPPREWVSAGDFFNQLRPETADDEPEGGDR